MTMCVLVGAVEYGWSDVLGVYESRDGAIEARDGYVARCEADTDHSMTHYDFFVIHTFVVGAEATDASIREEV